MGIEEEIKDRMLRLEEDNRDDTKEYEQLKDALASGEYVDVKVQTPEKVSRYPETDSTCELSVDTVDRERTEGILEAMGYSFTDRHGYIRIFGKPSELAVVSGVRGLSWGYES